MHTCKHSLNLLSPVSSLPSLCTFIDSIDLHIRALSSLGVFQDSCGTLLAPILISKLPAGTRRNMARDYTSVEWNSDDLKAAMLKEIRIQRQNFILLIASHMEQVTPDQS